jgi:hypothetical protein
MPRKPKAGPLAIPNLRHGLRAHTIAIAGLEDHAGWVTFRDGVVSSLAPEGDLELELARAVAECLWRRRRIPRHERQLVEVQRTRAEVKAGYDDYARRVTEMEDRELAGVEPSQAERVRNIARNYYGGMAVDAQIEKRIPADPILPAKEDLDRLIRYEAHLTRQVYHALHELQALQSVRRGEPAPLARLSVVGFSGA